MELISLQREAISSKSETMFAFCFIQVSVPWFLVKRIIRKKKKKKGGGDLYTQQLLLAASQESRREVWRNKSGLFNISVPENGIWLYFYTIIWLHFYK